MRISCCGCRVLRKGCSNSCSIRPCLQWIKSSESQSNATLFLAKICGRSGLINLINAAPQHLRPACGRIVNSIYGSLGLLWTGSWLLCQAAVEAVLKGEPITQISSSELSLKACDIRHVSKDSDPAALGQLHKVDKSSSNGHFKRSARKRKPMAEPPLEFITEFVAAVSGSPDSAVDRRPSPGVESGSGEGNSVSVEMVEASALSEPDDPAARSNLVLELALGRAVGDDVASKSKRKKSGAAQAHCWLVFDHTIRWIACVDPDFQ